nr:MAG TPA: hypothetical protein [Caudoviricetes sp.]
MPEPESRPARSLPAAHAAFPLFARLRPGFFRAFPHADASPAAESAPAPRPGALSQRTES